MNSRKESEISAPGARRRQSSLLPGRQAVQLCLFHHPFERNLRSRSLSQPPPTFACARTNHLCSTSGSILGEVAFGIRRPLPSGLGPERRREFLAVLVDRERVKGEVVRGPDAGVEKFRVPPVGDELTDIQAFGDLPQLRAIQGPREVPFSTRSGGNPVAWMALASSLFRSRPLS